MASHKTSSNQIINHTRSSASKKIHRLERPEKSESSPLRQSMCTGILAICICSHRQVQRWTTRCAKQCRFPSNHIQYVSFQCSECDILDQSLLQLSISKSSRLKACREATEEKWKRRSHEAFLEKQELWEAWDGGLLSREERARRERDVSILLRVEKEELKEECGERLGEIEEDVEKRIKRLKWEWELRLRLADMMTEDDDK
jgi:hypothetical protein